MKKLFFLLLITFFSVSAFSQKKFIGFDSALTTALPFYSDEKIQEYNKNVSDSPNRIVIGLEAAIKFNILTQLKLFLASSVQSDFNWNADEYSNHIDYDFSFGVKIYPNLYGFNFSIAYLIGQRADFINNSIDKKETLLSAWGNGFKLSLGYDFHHNSQFDCLPSLGFYYKFVPCGNENYDNYLGFFIGLAY